MARIERAAAAGLLCWALAGCGPAGAGAGDDGSLEMSESEGAMRRLAEVWNSHDDAGLENLYAPDAVFQDMAFDRKWEGLSEIRELFAGTWQGIPDLHTELTRVVVGDEWVAGEWTLTGTHSGDFPELPATGREISIRGVSVVHVKDGRIVAQRDYYDRAAFLEQLGMGPGDG